MAPVLEHPIHDKVRHAAPPAGCKDRVQMSDGYWAKDGFYAEQLSCNTHPTITQKVVWVEHVMSKKCRQINMLPECNGCQAEKDAEYIERMRNI